MDKWITRKKGRMRKEEERMEEVGIEREKKTGVGKKTKKREQ